MSQDYIVSARKYRPSTFQSVVGQKALVQTLKNAIASDKLAHAYLFCGPRGVGKTSCARIFAKTINCQHPTAEGDACNECESCRAFNEQRSLNIHELDAASNNSVDNIRDLIEQVHVPPQIGRYKVFIIDEVHMLSTAAFNAFLKTLEEPPAHAIFILATTEKQKILPTILSRCQTYDFQRISVQDIVDHLSYVAAQEGISAEPQALQVIARKADGGMRDALSVFDQIASFTAGHVTYQSVLENLGILDYELFFRMTDAALQGNVPAALVMLDDVMRRGFDAQLFVGGWASHLRDLMMSKDAATLALVQAGQDVAMRYQQQAARCSLPFLYTALQVANDCDFNYRNSRNKRLSVEVAIIKICQLNQAAPAPAQPQRPAQPQAPQPAPAPATPQAYAPRPQAAPVVRDVTPTYQTTPPPAPAPTPTAPQPRPAGASRFAPTSSTGHMAGTRTTSLHAVPNQGAAAAAGPAAAQQPEEHEPVDDSALRRTWREFTKTIPTENFVSNTMLSCIPVRVEGERFQVTVFNQEQRERLTARHEVILRYLRAHLHNTDLNFDIVQAAPNAVHRPFTPREKFNAMRATNSTLQEMVEAFGLEFA
jgi:DNA polymerase-3 subunit gamma/tau